jgi:hypothetical protein
MTDEQRFRRFLAESCNKARIFSESGHLNAEVRDVLKDLIEVASQVDKIVASRGDGGADLRMLQKKFDTLKAENRETQKSLDKLKAIVTTDLVASIKAFASEATQLESLDNKFPEAGLRAISQRIKATLAGLIETIKLK